MKLVFIADYFVEQILGGGELNNEQVIDILKSRGYEVKKINSHLVDEAFIEDNKEHYYIVANFVNLSENCKNLLLDKKYIIYEHDHKYLRVRNPGLFQDFIAPKEQLINIGFYRNAQSVLCQSQFHLDIIRKNINLDNLVNLSGNLWDTESLEFMRTVSQKEKRNLCSIMSSNIEHKNTTEAIMYCQAKNLEYALISDNNYYRFLEKLGANKKFVFFPKTPETLSRVVVEARMMNMQVIVNKMIGATREPWFSLKGEELIDLMIEKRDNITDTIIHLLR
ncbi:MAG: hypothetical protein CMC55_06060 [Flavobacteriaceae bacterium]|jgi:hypothetical protein|nr:hypothetical protein [Flavobacteriaceae bacterium]